MGLNDNWCASINVWDAEDRNSYFMKELYTFDFRIRTLITAFQNKYKNLFKIDWNSDLKELVPELDNDGISMTFRHDFPSEILNDFKANDMPRLRVRGEEGFWEENIE